MASTTFTTGTVIASSWLNDVNAATYTEIPAIKANSWVTTARLADGAVTGIKLASGAALSNLGYTPVNKAGDTLSGALNYPLRLSVPSAATTDIGAVNCNSLLISGTTTITSLGNAPQGTLRTLTFSGALTLTNGGGILLPGGANITTATNDVAEFISLGGVWQCTSYTRLNGTPLAFGDATIAPSKLTQPFTRGTAVATTSGTAVDFTGIPSWVKRITVVFNVVSTTGTSHKLIQIGSGSITTSGYSSGSAYVSAGVGNTTSTAGFVMFHDQAADSIRGTMVLTNISGNIWVANHTFYWGSSTNSFGGGSITLAGTIDRLRLTTVGGIDTFDSGSVNIFYE